MREYTASLGNLSKIITSSVVVFLFGITIILFYNNSLEPQSEYTFGIALTFALTLLPAITFFYRPKSYLISNDSIQVQRLAGNYRIPLSVIDKVFPASVNDMKLTIRIFGNGGMFGFTGYFRNSHFGKMRWFVTQRKHFVVIETKAHKKIVISPDEPEKLISDLNRRLHDA
jgi:PH (Pleckstrin Homology) domain-containing protein